MKKHLILVLALLLTHIHTQAQSTTFYEVETFGLYGSPWARVKKNGKYGFINERGKITVEPIYDQIDPFGINGTTWAMVMKNKKYGFIDRSGREVVEPIYDKIHPFGINGTTWAKVVKNGKHGFIDDSGNPIEFSSNKDEN
ncbi:MAG: hypothetical protein COW40_01315 [Cytophagales bacterium CG17_big_fil_post_rev_8_21_14_2_50_40_13]|nr:MAG: hypothetical protein COW40_01315 [Cytophagales bacterium CG17_big_fil_post_rev_8_21_14_2_50_40_13]